MSNDVKKLLDETETKMDTLIGDYNDKVETNDTLDTPYIETCDLSSLFSQLNDFIEDHS